MTEEKQVLHPSSKKGQKGSLGNSQLCLGWWESHGVSPLGLGLEKAAAGTSQHGLNKGKLCLTNLIACYGRTTGAVDEGRATDVIHLNFHNTFNTTSHNLLYSLCCISLEEGRRQLDGQEGRS